jgi:uncharacterized membrane protein YfcA
MNSELAILMAIVFLANGLETVIGFGGTLIIVSVGAQFWPLKDLLMIVLPLNMLLTTYISFRYREKVAWKFLYTRVVPIMSLGVIAGYFSSQYMGGSVWPQRILALVLIFLAGRELFFQSKSVMKQKTAWQENNWLVVGGIGHGLFFTGGPFIVYVIGSRLHDPQIIRPTLSSLWLTLNSVLLVVNICTGNFRPSHMDKALFLVPGVLAGLLIGELLAHKINQKVFRRITFIALLFVGIYMGIKSVFFN